MYNEWTVIVLRPEEMQLIWELIMLSCYNNIFQSQYTTRFFLSEEKEKDDK